MTGPAGNWEPQPKYQRDLEPGELEELNRLRAWKEEQEREAEAQRLRDHHQQIALEEQQRRVAEHQQNLYAQQQNQQPYPHAHQQYPPQNYAHQQFHGHPQSAYPPPQPFAPIQQVTVNNVKRADCPHLLHLVLTLITCGAWLPVWIIHAIIVAARN